MIRIPQVAIALSTLCALSSSLGCDSADELGEDYDPVQDPILWSTRHSSKPPTIVLVHGAFADGSGWQKIIPLLERDGYPVIAVQNPLTSLADDIATTSRVIDAAAKLGPVVVVGHSFGGAVMTAAAADNPAVEALVYIAAFAPEIGEVLGPLTMKFGGELGAALVPDSAGFLYIDREKFQDLFCADVSRTEAAVMAAVQKPVNSHVLGEQLVKAAWKQIPSFYLVSQDDKTIVPELQRFMAQRMNARTQEIRASHVSFISRPRAVVRFIEEAVDSIEP
jgi:pimeloyl-ACP methyl ester carboxylesterase